MTWLLLLAIAAAPDGGTVKPGIVEFGSQIAGESWGPDPQKPLSSSLDVSSPQLAVRGPLNKDDVRKVLAKEHHRFDSCSGFGDFKFVLELDVNFRGVVSDKSTVRASPRDSSFEKCI